MKMPTAYNRTGRNVARRSAVHEEPDDGREQEQHDQIVDRHLHERICGIAIGQIAPDRITIAVQGAARNDTPCYVLVGPLVESRPQNRNRKNSHAMNAIETA